MSLVESRLLRNTMDLESFGRGTARKLVKELTRARDRVLGILASLGPDRLVTRRFNQELLASFAKALERLEVRYPQILSAVVRETIREDYRTLGVALKGDANVERLRGVIPAAEVKEILTGNLGGRTLGDWISRHLGRLKEGVRREMAQSQLLGEGSAKAARRLRHQFGLSRNRADILARTTLLQASSQTRERFYDDNDSLIESYTYLATLDSRTCTICGPWDGVTRKKRRDLPKLTRHPRCRCIIRPNTEFAEPLPRPAVTETDEHVVHHRDGTTSTRFTPVKVKRTRQNYEEFFNAQPAAWKRDRLGPTRYKLLREGTLELDDLASRNHVLTLKQLRRNFGISKEEMGLA